MRAERLAAALVALGFALIVAGAVLLMLAAAAVNGGGGAVVVVVGPVPVAVGWGEAGPALLVVAAVLTLIMLLELLLLAGVVGRVVREDTGGE